MADQHNDLPRFNHPASTKLLFVVFGSLIALTILTVVTSAVWPYSNLPPDLAFPVAMIIASVKAFLVCAFFMHMWWDKTLPRFHRRFLSIRQGSIDGIDGTVFQLASWTEETLSPSGWSLNGSCEAR